MKSKKTEKNSIYAKTASPEQKNKTIFKFNVIMPLKKVDVVIVGAGLTGLTLAFYLEKAGKKVALIEKSDRLGGAIQTIHEKAVSYKKNQSDKINIY